MKQILIILLLIPSLVFGTSAFTEYYCQSGGSNLNAGSTTNNTALYTATNGGWNSVTGVYTPTDGTNPVSAGVATGQFASVYVDGASVAVFIGRITAVTNSANGTITVSVTIKMGAVPSTNASARTIKVGGAWSGMGGTTSFPFTLNGPNGAINTSNDQVRINLKNDQTYTLTGSLDISNSANVTTQGYTTSPGDLGRATITTNVTSSYGSSWTGTGQTMADIIFTNTGASNGNDLVRCSGTGTIIARCVFKNGRGGGLFINSSGASIVQVYDSEFFGNNTSNTASKAGCMTSGNGTAVIVNGYSHDNTGSNTDGFLNAGANLVLLNCISETNGANGAESTSVVGGWVLVSINSDYYNNTGDAVKVNTSTTLGATGLRNNIFTKNGGKGINNTVTSQSGLSDNNVYGAGTEANGGADVLKSIVDNGAITLGSNISPYNAATTGDFRITSSAVNWAGTQNFTETDGTNTGTIGYPDCGAAQSKTGPGGTFSKESSYGFGQ